MTVRLDRMSNHTGELPVADANCSLKIEYDVCRMCKPKCWV
jgi:hypothetical protein